MAKSQPQPMERAMSKRFLLLLEGEEEQGKDQYDGNTYRKNAVGFDLMGIGDGNNGSANDLDFYIRLRLAGFPGTVF